MMSLHCANVSNTMSNAIVHVQPLWAVDLSVVCRAARTEFWREARPIYERKSRQYRATFTVTKSRTYHIYRTPEVVKGM